MDERSDNIPKRNMVYTLDIYRWVVLFLFCFVACINSFQYLQYTVIWDIMRKYYNLERFDVSWTFLVFMIPQAIFFIPASYLMEKYDLRNISIGISFMTTLGVGIKFLSIHPDNFLVLVLGQFFCGIGHIFTMIVPSKLAAVWFGKNEVSTACGFAVAGTQIGILIACVLSNIHVTNGDIEEIGDQLFTMVVYNFVFSFIALFMTSLLFRAKPQTPPSYSQSLVSGKQLEYFKSLKKLLKNRDYILLLIGIGVSNGLWHAFGIELHTINKHYFEEFLGDGYEAIEVAISRGLIGGIIFGFIIDRTHKFKDAIITNVFLSFIIYVVMIYLMTEQLHAVFVCAVGLYGVIWSGSLTVSFEYATELTYPEPQSIALALLNAVTIFFGMILALSIDALFVGCGYFWTNVIIAIVLGGCSAIFILMPANNLRRFDANKVQDIITE